MARISPFHKSLHRPRLIMGIEKGSFAVLLLLATFFLVAQLYMAMLFMILPYFVAKWLTKKDDQFVAVFAQYLMEDHAFDSQVRPGDFNKRPARWGRGLPI